MAHTLRTARRRAVVAAVSLVGVLLTGVTAEPAAAAVTTAGGSAYGYLLNVALFGGPVNTRGPAPLVTLPAGGSVAPVTASAATGSAVVTPATFFTSGAISLSTQGTPGATGSVTTSTSISTVNTSGQEAFTANGVTSTCTAAGGGRSGSTTVSGGTLLTDSGEDLNDDGDFTDAGEHAPVSVTVPTNPAANTTYLGHLHVNGVTESFRYVFNEQVTNADGTITVNAGHQYILGPTAVGELTFGQSVCRAEVPTYAPVTPFRLWDSRVGPGPIGQLSAGGIRNVTVTGLGGVPATGVHAVVLNVTAVDATANTYVTAWPAGEFKPLASNLNVPPGDTRPNLVTVKVGAGGQVSFYNDLGSVHLIADIAGWYGHAGGQRYTAVSPNRVWDSRSTPGPSGTVGPGVTRNVTVTGTAGVPPTGVSAVVLNVVAVGPTASTYLTAWPTGEDKPLASNLNVPPGDTRPNLVIVKVGAGGQVSFYNNLGNVDVVADVAGYFGAAGSSFASVTPDRVWDSRSNPGPFGRVGPAGVRNVTVTGIGGVPASGVSAVVLNVTAVLPTDNTFITVWPTGEGKPLASNLNVPPGDVRPNLVIVKVGASGQVSFYNDAGQVDLVADIAGWYGASGI